MGAELGGELVVRPFTTSFSPDVMTAHNIGP